jgi:hypothetical protein
MKPMKISKNIAISDAGLVFNPVNGESYSVNPIGLEIISMIRNGMTFPQISESILSQYNTDDATFEKDFQDFYNLLNHYELSEKNEEKKA